MNNTTVFAGPKQFEDLGYEIVYVAKDSEDDTWRKAIRRVSDDAVQRSSTSSILMWDISEGIAFEADPHNIYDEATFSEGRTHGIL